MRRVAFILWCLSLVCLLGAPMASATPSPAAVAAKPAAELVTSQGGKEARQAPAAQPKAAEAAKPGHAKKKKKKGVHPCMTPDPGFGLYTNWSRKISLGQMIAPQRGGLTKGGGFDVIVHFHGHYPIRKEFVKVPSGIVLVAIDLGVGSSAYTRGFADPRTFERLLDSVTAEMKRHTGRDKVYIRKLALSSWSAGFGAVLEILKQPLGKKVDALVMLDSIYGGYKNGSSGEVNGEGIKPFIQFARAASRGQKLMFQSHSSIPTPGYASTREVSEHMVKALGGKLRHTRRNDVLGLELFERFDRGKYYVRGYRGDDKPDHCAHLGLMKDVLKVHFARRWSTPRARAAASVVAAKAAERHDRREKKIAKHDKQPSADKPIPKGARVHVVAPGHSLGRIARRYHVTVDAIRKANGLHKGGKKIQPGQKLIIP